MTETAAQQWTVKGKHVIITGATSGIGLAAAKELARRGAHLGIVARSEAKANAAASQIKAIAGEGAAVDLFLADMASQQSVRQAAQNIMDRWPRIDVLINNAGAMFVTRQLSADGIELTWAAHGHRMARSGIRFDDLGAEKLYGFPQSLLGGANARYGETKLANVMFTAELARRLEGTGVMTACYDPGLVATNFNQDNGTLARMTMAVMKKFSREPEQGADTMVWLADSGEMNGRSGLYYKDRECRLPSEAARDREAAVRLWQVSEEQTRA